MRRSTLALGLLGLLGLFGLFALSACASPSRARSRQSFDEIAARVAGMTAAEVAAALGDPDSRQPVFLRDERWTWWNFTYLAGGNYPPEVRGQVVHLEITFRNPGSPGGESRPYSEWRIAQPFGVGYLTPGTSTVHTAGELATVRQGA